MADAIAIGVIGLTVFLEIALGISVLTLWAFNGVSAVFDLGFYLDHSLQNYVSLIGVLFLFRLIVEAEAEA